MDTASEQAEEHAEAVAAAESWLQGIDRGDATATWDGAATLFRDAVTREDWAASLEQAQASLGRPRSRTLEAAEAKSEIPGAPDGDYVVLQFATRFEKKEQGVETIVPMKDTDGVWRVSGYFVR